MIDELRRCPRRSENVYFANNEEVSISVFTAAFCFTYAKHNLIKLILYNNWSGQAVSNISKCAMWNSKKPIKFFHHWKLVSQSTLNQAHVIEITKRCTVAFMKARNYLVVWWREEKRKTEDGENVLFKALAKNFFVGMSKLFMVELLSNALHEKVICYIIKLLKVD